MKIYSNADDSIRVGAELRDGKYVIVIEKQRKILVASKNSTKAHIEYDYSHYEKTFTDPKQANAYFMGIKKNHPTLKAI